MSDEHKLEAQLRERGGKGAARELRRNEMVPAVIYGDKKAPLSIALPIKETALMIRRGGFMTNILTVTADGKNHKVLPKDFQLHPVKDTLMHVDLLRVSDKTVVTVDIPVHFLNEEECAGLKEGGTLNVVRYTVEVNCPANSIPEHFEVDLTPFGIGDSVNISDVALAGRRRAHDQRPRLHHRDDPDDPRRGRGRDRRRANRNRSHQPERRQRDGRRRRRPERSGLIFSNGLV